MKRCGGECKTTKPISEFYARNGGKGYRSVCKDCHKKSSRKWLQDNPDREKQHQRKYIESHRDAVNKLSRNWKANNPERAKEISSTSNAKRRSLMKDAPLPSGFWKTLLEFYGDQCMATNCSKSTDLELDHVVALAKGGTHSMDNFQILCRSCNAKKSTKTIDYRDGKIAG